MQFNSSLNRFGNLRDNQYRELVNDEFNDARSQVIARQFTQSKQFLETYEREKVGDRLVNLEVAKTVTAFNNAIIKSTNQIDNNEPNSEEGIIVAYRVAIDMLDAYINSSGTKTRDTERYKQMLYQSIPSLNTYYEKASQLDKIGIVKSRELEKIAEIINRLEGGYSQGQNFNGKNIAANIVIGSLDEVANGLVKDIEINYQILLRLFYANMERANRVGSASREDADWLIKSKTVIDDVSGLLDFYKSGRLDYKAIATLFRIPLLPEGGKPKKKLAEDREKLIKSVIDKLRTYLLEVKTLNSRINNPFDPANIGELPSMPQPSTLPFSPSAQPFTPAPAPAPAQAPAFTDPSVEVSESLFRNYWRTIYEYEKKIRDSPSDKRVASWQRLSGQEEARANKIATKLRELYNVPDSEIQQMKEQEKERVGAGRRRGGVARTTKSSQFSLPMRNDSLRFEKRQVKEFDEEPSLKFHNLYPAYGQRVNRQTEGAGKKKSNRRVILFEKI